MEADRCPRCGAPVAPVAPGTPSTTGTPDDLATARPWQVRDTVAAGPRAPTRVAVDRGTRDWAGAARSVLVAGLATYVLAAAVAVLLVPAGSEPAVSWVGTPSALLAVALGGRWQMLVPDPDGGIGPHSLSYEVRAFPLLLTGALALVLARAVHGRFATGRANDTVRQRLGQACRVAAVLAAFGLVAALLSRHTTGDGTLISAGYLAAPIGGLVLGGIVAGAVAVSYDTSQLAPVVRMWWERLAEPARAVRTVVLVAGAVGTFGILLALEAAPADGDPVTIGQDRRLLSGLAISAAPNLGWWLLGAFLGMPVRADLVSGGRAAGLGSVLSRSPLWWPATVLAACLLLVAGVRLVRGAENAAAARRRIAMWCGMFFLLGLVFAVAGGLHLRGDQGLWPLEYEVGGTWPAAVLLPPLWAGLAGAAALGLVHARRRRS